jgi:flagellin FlaB
MRKVHNSQRGITGLETAIILIAFVMVASVFSYVILSAGLFSSQKAKEAIHTGLQKTRSSVDLKGNVIGWVQDGNVTTVYFTVVSIPGADPVDFTNTTGSRSLVVSYSDKHKFDPDVVWGATRLTSNGNDYLLDENELFQIAVYLNSPGSAIDPLPGPYDKFTLEVKPPSGAVLTIERTVPARVNEMVTLY